MGEGRRGQERKNGEQKKMYNAIKTKGKRNKNKHMWRSYK